MSWACATTWPTSATCAVMMLSASARSTVYESWSWACLRSACAWSSCRLRRPQRSFGLVIIPSRGIAASQQRLLALERGCRLPQHRVARTDAGLSRGELGLLLLRIEPRQHLALRHVIADIDQPFDDLAADAERQIGADLRGHNAGERDRRRKIDDLRRHRPDARQRDLCAAVILAAHQAPQAHKPHQYARYPKSPFLRHAIRYGIIV